VAGVALAAVAGFFHWITAGPNEVQPEDDIAAAKLIQGSGRNITGDVA
jgi:formate dehydrogenase iron-sulfur subunit